MLLLSLLPLALAGTDDIRRDHLPAEPAAVAEADAAWATDIGELAATLRGGWAQLPPDAQAAWRARLAGLQALHRWGVDADTARPWVLALYGADVEIRERAARGAYFGALTTDDRLRVPDLGRIAEYRLGAYAVASGELRLYTRGESAWWSPGEAEGDEHPDRRSTGWWVTSAATGPLVNAREVARALGMDGSRCSTTTFRWSEPTAAATYAPGRLAPGAGTDGPAWQPGGVATTVARVERSAPLPARPDACLSRAAVEAAVARDDAQRRAELDLAGFRLTDAERAPPAPARADLTLPGEAPPEPWQSPGFFAPDAP